MKNEQLRLGWIGLGNMGHPMAKNLEKAGLPLSVFNRTKQKTQAFSEHSNVCQSIKDLVLSSDIIFTMLSNDTAVRSVYEEILNEKNLAGKIFVDMSTISRECSITIAEELKLKDASLIDAPVAGSTQPAKEGTLIIMVGGSSEDAQKVTPYLNHLGKKVKYLGQNGKGLSAKLSINYFLSMLYEGLAETVLLSEKLGVPREDLLELLNESASGSGATKVKTPLLIQRNYQPAFALELMLKDLNLAINAGADFAITKALKAAYDKAIDQKIGSEDVIGIIRALA